MTKTTHPAKQVQHNAALEALYKQALNDFPYGQLTATETRWTTQSHPKELIRSEGFSFPGQKLAQHLASSMELPLDKMLEGWAIIDLRDNKGEISIEMVGDIARNGDWKKGRVLAEKHMIYGHYRLEDREWKFWVSR